jgi:hypothetical protein
VGAEPSSFFPAGCLTGLPQGSKVAPAALPLTLEVAPRALLGCGAEGWGCRGQAVGRNRWPPQGCQAGATLLLLLMSIVQYCTMMGCLHRPV